MGRLDCGRLKQRPKNPKSKRNQARRDPFGAGVGANPAPVLTPGRKWLFRIAAVLLVTLLELGGLEVALRLAGYGYDPHFFKKTRVGNEELLTANDSFVLRFFPPRLARTPEPVLLKAKKPAGTYRIFILGESAALGDPAPAYGAGRYLGALLRERFPGETFEIINVGITAINSHTVLSIARECRRLEGDCWIIYMGNNEMVGPYGAVTVFGAKALPLGVVRLSLALQQTRVGQVIMALGRRLRGGAANTTAWAGMQMFLENKVAPHDRQRETVYRNFQGNLRDIVHAGLASGASVILNTVAVNLRDCPPFASVTNGNLGATARASFEGLYAEGCLAEGQGKFGEAARRFERAAELDPQHAEAQYRWGDCLVRLTNAAAARGHFQLACDLDALPFRADSPINDLITRASRGAASPHLRLLDAAGLLATNSPAGIPGEESFYEHVHLSFDGNYVLARGWAEQIKQLRPKGGMSQTATGWASQAACERWLGLTDWNRCSVLDEVIQRRQQPPLSAQFNNGVQRERLQAWKAEMRQRMDSNAAAAAREQYVEALREVPGDYYLHANYGDFLEARGDFGEAIIEWQRAHELMPQYYLPLFRQGELLAQQGKWAEAEAAFRQTVTMRADLSDNWFQLGEMQAAQGKLELALEQYGRAKALRPQDARFYAHAGSGLAKLHRPAEAIQLYREAIRLRPEYWEAHMELGVLLGQASQVVEARNELIEVIRLKPDYAMAHLNLGVALMMEGQLDGAQRQLEETLRLEPGNRLALANLEQIQASKGLRGAPSR